MPSGALQPRQFGGPIGSATGLVLNWYQALKSPSSTMRSDRNAFAVSTIAADVRQRHVGAAGMQVGDHRDGELAVRRASRAASARKA